MNLFTICATLSLEVKDMIHIYMKEQYVARKERIIIKDESGKDIYLITGKWGNVGDGLYLYKIDGTLVAEVKQTKLSLMPKFDIYLSGKKVCSVSKYPGIHNPYFRVSRIHWIISGDFANHHYKILHLTKTVMTMDKVYLASGDFYALSIKREQDLPLCVCLAVILDHWVIPRAPAKDGPLNLPAY